MDDCIPDFSVACEAPPADADSARPVAQNRIAKPAGNNVRAQPAKPADRQPPQDLDAEMALLGSMMMDRAVIDEVAALVPDSSVFYVPAHGILYNAMLRVHADGKPVDLITMSAHLRGAGDLELIGGQDYMMQLAESFADWSNAEHYARIVVAKWQRRELIRLGLELVKAGYDDLNDDPAEDCATFGKRLDNVAEKNIHNDVRRMDDLFKDAMASLSEGGGAYVPCGIPTFDKDGGLQRPGYTILAARTSTGKTTVAMRTLYEMSRMGTPGLLISAEMDQLQVALRAICALTGDSIARLKNRASPADAEHTLAAAYKAHGASALYITDRAHTLRKMIATIRQCVRRYKIGVVAIDYVQLIRAEGRWESKHQEISHISKALKAVAYECGVALLLLAQLSRKNANPDASNPPTLDDLKESGSLEEDADQVIMLYPLSQAEWRMQRNASPQLVIDKQKDRNGPILSTTATFHKASFQLQFSISAPIAAPTAEDLGPF